SEVVFRYLLEAVHLVADQGWKLLGDYRFDPATALWRHRRGRVGPPRGPGRPPRPRLRRRAGRLPRPGAAAAGRPPPRRRRRRRAAARAVGRIRGAAPVRALART